MCKVLELRESRLDHEETLAEVQKAADEHKRNHERQVRLDFDGSLVEIDSYMLPGFMASLP